MQKTLSSSPCLLGLFHVKSRFNPSVQHVFAVASRKHGNGVRQVLTINTNQERIYLTQDVQGECNAAIIHPITPRGFETLRNHFELAKALGITPSCDLPLYYFSKDMTPKPDFELWGRRAVDPFGTLEPHHPPRQNAYLCDPDSPPSVAGSSILKASDGQIRARTNCVVMSRYAAFVAGVDEGAVDPAFSTVQRAAAFAQVLARVMTRDLRAERVLKTDSGKRFVLRRHETDREQGLGRKDARYLTLYVPGRGERMEAVECLDSCEAMLSADAFGERTAPIPSL